VRALPWADEAEQQLSRLAPSGCQLSADVRTFRAGLRKAPGCYTIFPRLRLKFEVARQARSPILCASVRALPWAHEDEQQLSRLAPSGCQLSAEVRTFGAGLRKEPGWDTNFPRLRLKFEVARQASSPILCLSVRALPWADEAEQQLYRLAPFCLPAICRRSHFRSRAVTGAWQGHHHSQHAFEVSSGKTRKQPHSLCLCASTAMGR